MPLLTANQLDFGVGGPLLLNGIEFSLDRGERVALIGRNGTGKSTLLKLINDELQPDDGVIHRSEGLRVARMAQEPDGSETGSLYDVIAAGLGNVGSLLQAYHHLSHAEEFDADALAEVQHQIEAVSGWDLSHRVESMLTKLGMDGETDFATLSGGQKRRVLLARAQVSDPDILLLDEPTNHLDLAAILGLEEQLKTWPGCIVFVTHDRRFLRTLATRIIEIDRGQLTSWPGDYENFLRRRDERMHAEALEQARFDKKMAAEEVWIRQGIKARRVRDEGRVRRLEAMRMAFAERRNVEGKASMEVSTAEQSGKRVLRATDVFVSRGGRQLLRNVSLNILRGDRIGIVGANGSGKSTLIKTLLGELQPDAGEIVMGTSLKVAYFDQYRETLNESLNAIDNVGEGMEFIEIGGKRKHILGYLQDFLFTPERARAPITRLSGGERHRLLLARLFARPSNVLIMDEPTNDLDIETLELLEELVIDYPGTVMIVSHDREFLDHVVTSTLWLDGQGGVRERVGGYSEQEREGFAVPAPAAAPAPAVAKQTAVSAPAPRKPSVVRLTQAEQRELKALPATIEQLETRIAERTSALSDPAFFKRPADQVSADQQQLAALQSTLDETYQRWEALEARATA